MKRLCLRPRIQERLVSTDFDFAFYLLAFHYSIVDSYLEYELLMAMGTAKSGNSFFKDVAIWWLNKFAQKCEQASRMPVVLRSGFREISE
jgi:hypothetical protein